MFTIVRLKQLLLYFYSFLKTKEHRTFWWLNFRLSQHKRYKKKEEIKVLGFKITIIDSASFLSQFYELFISRSYAFKARETPLIIDCGSNIGMSCLYFKSIYPKATILALEADPDIAKVLEENMNKNKFNDIKVIPKAVWINNKGITFATEGADAGSIFGKNSKKSVLSIRLKDILKQYELIDLLKIDIEGAELEVLEDCKDQLHKVTNLIVEYHSWNNFEQKLDVLLSLLKQANYRYSLESINNKKMPLVNHTYEQDMDLQANVYCIKNEARNN